MSISIKKGKMEEEEEEDYKTQQQEQTKQLMPRSHLLRRISSRFESEITGDEVVGVGQEDLLILSRR